MGTDRCIIPASGYYEWTGAGKNTVVHQSPNQPARILFRRVLRPFGRRRMSCSILTRPALPELEHLHPRMPVMLSGDELMPWLRHGATDDDVRNHFGLSSGQMNMHPVRPLAL